MNSRTLILATATTLLALLALPVQLAAQHTRYKLIDIGTFGGPASYFTSPGIGPGSQVLSNRGMLGEGLNSVALQVNNGGQVVGISTINIAPDPFGFAGGSIHPFLWQNGVMQDLGTLGGPDAFAFPGCGNERNNLVTGVSLT